MITTRAALPLLFKGAGQTCRKSFVPVISRQKRMRASLFGRDVDAVSAVALEILPFITAKPSCKMLQA